MQAQAAAEQQRAAVEAQWAERRALEERASAQQAAGQETRKARLAQGRLGAVAGASGSGASDPSVMTLFEGIEKEGQQNAGLVQAAGDQKAAGITYQAALDRWTADTNARIKRAGAKSTLMGGYIGALAGLGNTLAGSMRSRMALRYPGMPSGAGQGTGYWD
jgi:hypothetical protein